MANVVLSCARCSSELGCFRNSWIGIGNSYFSPVYPPTTFLNGFEATGDVFAKGQDGSTVQNSVLQDLACRQCGTVVGLRCDDAPFSHILKKNQLILRLAEMNVVSEQTREKASVFVQQRIPLVSLGTKKATQRAATVQPMPRHQTPVSLNQDIEARPINGNKRSSLQLLPGNDVARFSTWVEDAIQSQQKDINRISGAVTRMEDDIRSFRSFMEEVRAELKANRATRTTQQDLNQEQLAWLQEDLKELRQENGDFQQDLREEELPDIRNQLDQLRQEIDSQEHATVFPNDNSMSGSANELQRDLLDIQRKYNEIDGLKTEMQRLQKGLNEIGAKIQHSLSFPITLTTPNHSFHAESPITSVPKIAQQRPHMMLPVSEDYGAQYTMSRHSSPTQNPPGTFPESIIELGPTPRGVTPPTGKSNAVSANARSHRTVRGRATSPVAELAVSRPVVTHRWSLTGLGHWQKLRAAFKAFDMEYPKLGVLESTKLLEDHVNKLSLQDTAAAIEYGEVTLVGENNGDDETRDPSEFFNQPETSSLKRKHDQVEGDVDESASEAVKRHRGMSSGPAEKQQTNRDQSLKSPSLTSSHSRPDIPNHRAAVIVSSNQGSPELGRDSRFRSLHDEPVSSELANHVHLAKKRHNGGTDVSSRALQAQSNRPNEENEANPVHRRQLSGDELGFLPPLGGARTPASGKRTNVPSTSVKQLRMTIEVDAAVIPGAFPSDHADADAAAPDTPPANMNSEAILFDPRTDTAKHFKCGICGKKYKDPVSLKYHKTHSSCNDDSKDTTPRKFKCPICSTELSYGGLKWHLANFVCVGSAEQKQVRKQTTVVNEEQKRREMLDARERFVRETLEREMSRPLA